MTRWERIVRTISIIIKIISIIITIISTISIYSAVEIEQGQALTYFISKFVRPFILYFYLL